MSRYLRFSRAPVQKTPERPRVERARVAPSAAVARPRPLAKWAGVLESKPSTACPRRWARSSARRQEITPLKVIPALDTHGDVRGVSFLQRNPVGVVPAMRCPLRSSRFSLARCLSAWPWRARLQCFGVCRAAIMWHRNRFRHWVIRWRLIGAKN
jgi:hypothetical protein